MARKKILKNKTQIVEAALRLIESEGIEAVSMIRLSKELGVSSMTLYNYVRNAEEVLREILVLTLSDFFEQLYVMLNEEKSGRTDGVRAYARAYALVLYDLARQRRDICLYLVENYVRYHRDAELYPFYNPFYMFMLHCPEGEKQAQEEVSVLFRCAVFSLVHDHVLTGRELDRKQYERLVDRLLLSMFRY